VIRTENPKTGELEFDMSGDEWLAERDRDIWQDEGGEW
jgi:hypothetical protein